MVAVNIASRNWMKLKQVQNYKQAIKKLKIYNKNMAYHQLKTFIPSVFLLFGIYAVWCGLGYYNQINTKKLQYVTIGNITRALSKFNRNNPIGYSNKIVEIRHYPEIVAIQAIYRGVQFEIAYDLGLQDIGSYLLGKNLDSKKFQMIAPVMIERIPSQNAYLVSFGLPQFLNIADLSEPIDKRLTFRVIPARTMAAKAWRGSFPSSDIIDIKKRKLLKHLQQSQYKIIGNINIFEYDSPMSPAWMRQNQVLFQVQERTPTLSQ